MDLANVIKRMSKLDTDAAFYKQDGNGIIDNKYIDLKLSEIIEVIPGLDQESTIENATKNLKKRLSKKHGVELGTVKKLLESLMETNTKDGGSTIKMISGYDEYGCPTTNWYISVEWIENTVSQCEPEPYYYGTSTIVLPILNVLRCMCFEDMGEVRTFCLGGINMSSAITLNDGSKIPLPHVCADITIGPPSLVPSVEAALEKAGMSRRLVKMDGTMFHSEKNDGFTYEGLNLLKYFEELLEEGYKGHTVDQLMEYHKVLFTKHVEVPGGLVYPNYL